MPIHGDMPAPGSSPRYRTIFVSDVHLGSPLARPDRLLTFLEAASSENLFLVGDIVDGWSLAHRWYWPWSHSKVVDRLLEISRAGTRVVYVPGNHDEALRRFVGVALGGIECTKELVHRTADGRRLLVVHGDRFDSMLRKSHLTMGLGHLATRLVRALHPLAERGFVAWKERWKRRTGYLERFERTAIAHARAEGVDGIVCGHVHQAQIRTDEGIVYCNDGDWVQSCTALVEHFDGTLELTSWDRVADVEAPGVLLPSPATLPGPNSAADAEPLSPSPSGP